MQWFRAIAGFLRPSRRLVGTDLDGNKYYEIVRSGSHAGDMSQRTKREVVTKLKHDQYTPGTNPIEWESWIRGKREEPPTHEEIIARINKQITLKDRIQQVEKKEDERRAKEHAEGLVHVGNNATSAKPVGHASAPVYKDLNMKPQASTTSKGFQPGAWTPGTSATMEGDQKGQEAETYEPDAWVPPGTKK